MALPALAQERDDSRLSSPQKKTPISRAELGVAYLRLETAYWSHTPDDIERIRSINDAFDTATMAFFAGNLSQTLRVIDGLSGELIAGKPSDELLLAMSLKADCDPPLVIHDRTERAVARMRSLYNTDITGPKTIAVALYDTDPLTNAQATMVSPAREIALDPKADVAAEIDLTSDLKRLQPGTYHLCVQTDDGPLALARWGVVARSLDELRDENMSRLDQLETKDASLAGALAACRDRNALLRDRPSSDQSSQFLANPHELAQQIAHEIEALEAGRNPYARRAGDYWRTIRAEGKTIPLRVYAPAATVAERSSPLVIALHGAGGDENMFFEGYGVGIIKRLADQYQAIVATPSTYAFSKPEAFDALVRELSDTYVIDRQRIYVLGHSMGGGATSRLAADRSDKVAAACCLAGGGGRAKPTAMAPTLIIAAELDKIIPPGRLVPGAEKLQAQGLPVEIRQLENYGHTLMVGKTLPDAFAWLFQQPRRD
jgi:predicted esterase